MALIEMLPPPVAHVEDSGEPEFRELTATEIASVKDDFTSRGAPIPNPATSTFVGCVQGGEVIGYVVFQLKIHAEPLRIKDGKSRIFSRLISTAENILLSKVGPQWVYAFTSEERVTKLLEKIGMEKAEEWTVMCKLIKPELPLGKIVGVSVPEEETSEEVVQ